MRLPKSSEKIVLIEDHGPEPPYNRDESGPASVELTETINLLKRWLLVLSVAIICALGLIVVGVVKITDTTSEASTAAHSAKHVSSELSQALSDQTRNRVSNVREWCTAINDQSSVLEGFVAQRAIRTEDGKLVTLKLTHLPCGKLEHNTKTSASH